MKILIADDHCIVREGLRALLQSEQGMEVVGTAANGHEAISVAQQCQPDLVIMDMSMPLTDGPTAITHLRRRTPGIRILVLTFHNDEQHVAAALRAGADAYVLKDDSSAELLMAIRALRAGKSYLSPAICDRVMHGFLGSDPDRSGQATPRNGTAALTIREREVIKLIAEGLRTRQIAEFLSLSPKTVEKHRGNLMRKLNLRNAAAVTGYAIASGLVCT